jgi:hypothetical protein
MNRENKTVAHPRGLLVVWVFALAACAGDPAVVAHGFSFDMRQDGQDAEVVDYRYGDSKLPMVRNPEYLLNAGKSLQSTNITGEMRRGDFLYVKWRINSTGQVHEDNVDLRQRLPADIKDHRIYFMVRGAQLYVYLISPEPRSPEMQTNGPRVYKYLKTITIYPDQTP